MNEYASKNRCEMSNLKYKSKSEFNNKVNYTASQLTLIGSPTLPLSRRLSSIFKEFVVGMKLSYIHNNKTLSGKTNFDLDSLVSHNLQLLSKRLLQIPEYKKTLDEKIQSKNTRAGLWQSLYEDREITCGFLTIQGKQDMPCYTRPVVNGIYLLLSGSASLNQYSVQCINSKQVNFDILSSRDLDTGDIVFFKSGDMKLTNLSTSNDACVFLNMQLSSLGLH